MLLPDQESHRFANLMDKMESELIKNKRERELSIELNTGSEFIGRLEILTKIIDLNNCTYYTASNFNRK